MVSYLKICIVILGLLTTNHYTYHPVQNKNNDLFIKNCINLLQFVHGSHKKIHRSETIVTVISLRNNKTSVPFNILGFWWITVL